MAWLKKKFQGAMEKLEKEEKQKPQQLVEGDKGNNNYNKLDDVSELGESMTSQQGDFKSLLAKEQENEQNQENSEVDSDKESSKKSVKSTDSDRESGGKKSAKSDSDKESGKKSGKSSPETEKKPPSGSEKKKKVKTHRRVSSASALSALGGFIKKGHKRERSDGGIVIDPQEKQEKRSEDLPTQAFDDSSALLNQRKKELEKKERKEIELMFRAESPSKSAIQNSNPFRTSESPIPTGEEKEFTNMSFVIDGEEKEDTINQNEDIKTKLQDTLKKWQMHSNGIEQMYDLATRMVEKRKADMILAITEMANDLQTQLQNRYAKETEEAASTISKLHELNDVVNSNAWNSSDLQTSDIPRKPNSEPVEMVYDKDMDLKETLIPIFGQIEIRPISQIFGLPRDTKNTAPQKQERKCVQNTDGLLQKAEYRGVFVTKTSRDVRECGITDLTLTNDNEIVVVDRHNKLVKVFDYKGTLLRFIGRHSLKQPSRATVLPWSNQILVSDNASQTVNLYHSSGSILSNFDTDLKFPIAHCIVGDNQVAIVDFEPKEVVIYIFDQYGGYSKTKTFPVLTECPAYITSTAEGNIAVSDWSCNKVKIFDCNGELINQISKVGAGPGEFKKPQGVTGDRYGNLFVMEQTNHRIQVLNSSGEYLHKYDRSIHEFGVPMCMCTTSDGHFIVSEYQGNVKLFKYMDIPNMGLFNYEAPPPKPTMPAPPNTVWPMSDSPTKESESVF